MSSSRGAPVKGFPSYLVKATDTHVSHSDYLESPATAFLKYCNDARDAVKNCQNHFKKKKNGDYTKDSLASLQHIAAAMLPTIMGHLETYQRYLFAGVFEISTQLEKFDSESFFKALDKSITVTIDPIKLAAYRGLGAPVGLMLADNLSGWANPERVNSFFKSFGFRTNFYTNADCENLIVLWQLRHSIVHTGGTITVPDAQKVAQLATFGDQRIVFDHNFIWEVSRKFHPLIFNATKRLENAYRDRLLTIDEEKFLDKVDKLFAVNSSTPSWFS